MAAGVSDDAVRPDWERRPNAAIWQLLEPSMNGQGSPDDGYGTWQSDEPVNLRRSAWA